MNRLLSAALKQIQSAGESTANAISRTCLYEPEEDVILAKMLRSRQDKTDSE
ncbi:MAG: hypothetical protein NC314_04260 [Roseburia sp.]|nr:hypothetical protein [Ruminococcus sp.]MCM1155899.1 hypothetical protein [Roseburia sp.]MCM1242032.1 hypothetical protein [Roseburia sp.]